MLGSDKGVLAMEYESMSVELDGVERVEVEVCGVG